MDDKEIRMGRKDKKREILKRKKGIGRKDNK